MEPLFGAKKQSISTQFQGSSWKVENVHNLSCVLDRKGNFSQIQSPQCWSWADSTLSMQECWSAGEGGLGLTTANFVFAFVFVTFTLWDHIHRAGWFGSSYCRQGFSVVLDWWEEVWWQLLGSHALHYWWGAHRCVADNTVPAQDGSALPAATNGSTSAPTTLQRETGEDEWDLKAHQWPHNSQ